MKYSFERITTKENWELCLRQWPNANFLQSWNWGMFHQSLGKKVFFLHIKRGTEILGCSLLILEKAKRGNYFTIAGGPLLPWYSKEMNILFPKFLTHIRMLAKQEKAQFVRIRLQEVTSKELQHLMQKNGLLLSPMHLTADLTLQLDISKTEDEILKQMRKNTRYEIKKADKEGITIIFSKDKKDILPFYQNQLELARKHGFVPFSQSFLEKQFQAFNTDNQVLLIHAYKDRV